MPRRKFKIKGKGLQIGAAFGITNWGKKITNQGRDYKSGQKDYKSGQGIQIGAEKNHEEIKRNLQRIS